MSKSHRGRRKDASLSNNKVSPKPSQKFSVNSRLKAKPTVSIKEINKGYQLFLSNTANAVEIYEFLRIRNSYSPIFLKRNLSYLPKIPKKNPNSFSVDSLLGKTHKTNIKIGLAIHFSSLTLSNFANGNVSLIVTIIRGQVSDYFKLVKYKQITQKMVKIKLQNGKIVKSAENEVNLLIDCDMTHLTPSSVIFQLKTEFEKNGMYYCILPFFNALFHNQLFGGDYQAGLVCVSDVNCQSSGDSRSLIGFSVDKCIEKVGETKKYHLKRSSFTRTFRDSNVIFEFVFNEKHRKHFCSKSGSICAFCNMQCSNLNCLMIHLKHSHSRLTFHSVGGENTIIQVGINNLFDGGYEGNPSRLRISEVEGVFPAGPLYRLPMTLMLVLNGSRWRGHGPLVREVQPLQLVYHPMTCQPLKMNELSVSDDSAWFSWVDQMMKNLMDDFCDVNAGEKGIMKLWNSFLASNTSCFGDSHLVATCHKFVEEYKQVIVDNMLCHNFLLHLINLHHFGLIEAADILRVWESLVFDYYFFKFVDIFKDKKVTVR